MQDQQPRRSLPLAVVAGCSVLAIATGSAIAWWSTHQDTRPEAAQQANQSQPNEESKPPALPVTPDASKTAPSPPNSSAASSEQSSQIYWLQPAGDRLKLVPTPVQGLPTNSAMKMELALNQLLAGPINSSTSTTIPPGTTLKSVTVKEDGIHIDLSPEFTKGGGSQSMTGRVAQVIYTATSDNPDARVWLSVAGKPLETLGGEGLMLEYPITREQFQKDFPQQVIQ
jgi:spore germination protein GerM